jgi:hypothetical protein
MFWTVTRDFIVNWTAGAVNDLSSPSGMVGFAVTFGFVVYGVISWHRKHITAGKRGMDSWFFIAPALIVAVASIALAAYGIGLRASTAVAAAAGSPSAASLPTGAATAATVSTSDGGPIAVQNFLAIEGGPQMGVNVFSLRFKATNASQKEVHLKSGNLISAVNGTKVPIEVAVGTEILPLDQIELLPPGANLDLVAKFGPPDPANPGKILGLDPKIFLETWRQFSLNLEDDTRSYRILYNEGQLAPLFPGILGPHVTKKQSK